VNEVNQIFGRKTNFGASGETAESLIAEEKALAEEIARDKARVTELEKATQEMQKQLAYLIELTIKPKPPAPVTPPVTPVVTPVVAPKVAAEIGWKKYLPWGIGGIISLGALFALTRSRRRK